MQMIRKRFEVNVIEISYLKEYFLKTDYLKIDYIQECNFYFQHRYSIEQIIIHSPMRFFPSFTLKSIAKCFHKKRERGKKSRSVLNDFANSIVDRSSKY